MTDSFHIAGGCCGCVGRRGDEATDKFLFYHGHITDLKSDTCDNERGILSKYAEENVRDYCRERHTLLLIPLPSR